jgi:RNA polymerase sigma factor (sigma-70 family)
MLRVMGVVIPTDAELVQGCRAGQASAWAALVERFSRYVYAICLQAYRLSSADAEDVFQEVFARTFERLDDLRDDGAIRPWIGQLTRRLAIDRLRAAARDQATPADVIESFDGRADDATERIDRALAVHDAMGSLPEGCREVLDRFFARDESYAQIAEATGLAMGTIASRISRCLTKLREALEEEGW